jgi:hypothetical protein
MKVKKLTLYLGRNGLPRAVSFDGEKPEDSDGTPVIYSDVTNVQITAKELPYNMVVTLDGDLEVELIS